MGLSAKDGARCGLIAAGNFMVAGDDIGAVQRRAIDPNEFDEPCFQCGGDLPRVEWWAQFLGYEEGPCCSERCAMRLAFSLWCDHQPRTAA